ncbi:MAG: ABC transporter ATP-binding protein [Planctomycetaceae bacterium]
MADSRSDDVAVRVEDATRIYGSGVSAVTALDGVSFSIPSGERVALLGKSGSGKSTLLNILAGMDRPTTGAVDVAGRELSAMSARQMAAYRLQTVGMVFQSYNLVAARTAARNVELPLVFSGRPAKARREAAREALQAVGLEHRLNHRPSELSGGEQQRVAIARALMNDPCLLLADEPTGNLDSKTAGEIEQLLNDYLDRRGTTFLLVTHDEDLAHRAADRILRIQDGRLTE